MGWTIPIRLNEGLIHYTRTNCDQDFMFKFIKCKWGMWKEAERFAVLCTMERWSLINRIIRKLHETFSWNSTAEYVYDAYLWIKPYSSTETQFTITVNHSFIRILSAHMEKREAAISLVVQHMLSPFISSPQFHHKAVYLPL